METCMASLHILNSQIDHLSDNSTANMSGKQSGYNSQGNHYCTPGGSNSGASDSYHYSNTDGSYYYKNDNGYVLVRGAVSSKAPRSVTSLWRRGARSSLKKFFSMRGNRAL